jgi:hypothetical protein
MVIITRDTIYLLPEHTISIIAIVITTAIVAVLSADVIMKRFVTCF